MGYHLCIGVSIWPLSTILLLNFGNVPTLWYVLFFVLLIRYFRACGSYHFLDSGLLLTWKPPNQEFLVVKSSLLKLYGRRHELVNLCGIPVSQMTTDIFCLSSSKSRACLIHDLPSDCLTSVTRVQQVEHEVLILPENMSSPPVVYGVRARFAHSLVFCIVFCKYFSVTCFIYI